MANYLVIKGCRGSGKTQALADYIDEQRKKDPKHTVIVIRVKDLQKIKKGGADNG